jgi:hypothetical protein
MKIGLIACALFFSLAGSCQDTRCTRNIFIITIDGIRWEEIFKGANPMLISDKRFTENGDLARLMFIGKNEEENRKKLLPFFWNVIQERGQLYGNREFDNKVNVANSYRFSYPGYNEIFTGYPDLSVNSNHAFDNLNKNVLEYLNSIESYRNKVVAFTSWDLFPHILNRDRSHLMINSGYDSLSTDRNADFRIFNNTQENLIDKSGDTRPDRLTFAAAFDYIKAYKPKVVYIGFGECDEDAHKGRYDSYLLHLNEADKMIEQLWYYIQSTPEYRNKTTMIVTTDHGRGKGKKSWKNHGFFISGSADAWLAIIGPDIKPEGEIHRHEKIFQKQLAATFAALLGYDFVAGHPVATPLDFDKIQ